jgi:mutator protein MutT
MSRIRVVAAVIERGGRLLVCERPAHKRHGSLWEFPGGKVEGDETDFEAVARELAEELGVRVMEVGPVELSVSDGESDFVIEFLRTRIDGEPQALEHTELRWATPAELAGLALAPCDARYARERQGSGTASR